MNCPKCGEHIECKENRGKDTAPASLYSDLEDLYNKANYNHAMALKVIGAFDVKDLLLKYTPLAPKPEAKTEEGFVEGYKQCKCGSSSAYMNIHKVPCCGGCGAPLEVSPAPVNNGLNGWTLLALCDFIQDSVNKDHACIKIADDILSRHPATHDNEKEINK